MLLGGLPHRQGQWPSAIVRATLLDLMNQCMRRKCYQGLGIMMQKGIKKVQAINFHPTLKHLWVRVAHLSVSHFWTSL